MAPHISLSPPPSLFRRERRKAPRFGQRPSARRVRRVPPPWITLAVVVGVVATTGYIVLDTLSRRVPEIAPRHRAEALCFLLAEAPTFDPPMAVQPSTALLRGRFNAGTPASFALEQMMGFGKEHVLKQWVEHVGDYDVAAFWLHLPGAPNEHWLVLAWMEDTDLAVCNFRFTGSSPALSGEERAWGERITRRVLMAENFRHGELPATTLRLEGGRTMPVFGPRPD